jgi:von Willebrand factor type A domain
LQEWNLADSDASGADVVGPFGRFDAMRAYPATNESIARAKMFIRSMTAYGGRNLNDAMMAALNISRSVRNMDNNLTSIVILLTDGVPSAGVTDADAIASNIRSANREGHVSIFSLGLGQDADIELLKKISSQNGGFARGIDDISDASVQLCNFFEEVSSPVLTDVRFRYEGVDVNSLTERRLGHLFNGSEMVVAGKVQGALRAVVEGSGIEAKIYKPRIARQWATIENLPVQQSMAFMQVTNLLSQAPNNPSAQDQALSLALANQLVTPLTSAVAVISQPSGPAPKRSGSIIFPYSGHSQKKTN